MVSIGAAKTQETLRTGLAMGTDRAIHIEPDADICVTLDAPLSTNIFLGPNRVSMPKSFDLNTLEACNTTSSIVTMGRPAISRTADNGIFLWERAGNQWQVEIVSGDMPRIVFIAVDSQQNLTNVQQINLESSDSFTTSPMLIQAGLNVKAPWMDAFRFTSAPGSGTCVSTTNPDMPVYLGPSRVNIGSNINLDTQQACQ